LDYWHKLDMIHPAEPFHPHLKQGELMRLRDAGIFGALTVVAAFTLAPSLRAQVADASKAEIVATLQGGEALEALTQLPDGSIVYVANFASKLFKVSPDGKVSEFADLPAHPQVIVQSKTGFVVTAHERLPAGMGRGGRQGGSPPVAPLGGPAGGPGRAGGRGNTFADLGTVFLVLDKSGKVLKTIPGEKGQFFNGLAPMKKFYLVADTTGSELLKVDVDKGQVTTWLKDEQLGNPNGGFGGSNGLKANGKYVYVTVTSRNTIYRVKVDKKGNPAGPLTVYAEKVGGDDFGIAKDGTIYLPNGSWIDKITPDGNVSKLIENISPSPAAIVSNDGHWLYWLARGPMPAPGAPPPANTGPGGAGPALLVRLRL
jgi:hypothetical protein